MPFLFLLVFFATSVASAQETRALPDAPLASAHALFKQGKFAQAAAAYRVILEKDKSSLPAYAGLVQSYLKSDDVSAADEISSKALTALPQSALAHAIRGDVNF